MILSSSAILGQGYRLGFLGLLHMEVFSQRLEQEYDANVLITTPNVPYKGTHLKTTVWYSGTTYRDWENFHQIGTVNYSQKHGSRAGEASKTTGSGYRSALTAGCSLLTALYIWT